MPAPDLELLIDAARRASDIARAHVVTAPGNGPRAWEKPGGAGPVSEADLAVDSFLRAQLLAARPDYGWLSEETEDDPARRARDRVFIVDPIDGTRSFLEGSANWAHALAVVERGAVTAAVVYLPLKDKLYAAARGQGATLNGRPISVSATAAPEGASMLAARPALAPAHWRGAVPAVIPALRPSLAYRLSLVAEGRFDATLTLRPSWEWDIAAGALILDEAGARVTDRRGAPLAFNRAHPQSDGLLAANPALHGALLGALAGA